MAKINHFLLEYSDAIKIIDMKVPGKMPKVVIKRFIKLFDSVDDSRVKGMIEYPLSEILLIAFMAVLAGASSWVDIERFAHKREKWFKKFLKLENGIPSHDTFRRVFGLIDTQQLIAVTSAFLVENLAAIKKSLGIKETGIKHIAVDGKEQRGTGRLYGTDNEVKNLQTLHVYDVSDGIVLASKAIDSKTNEIPVAQDILSSMNLRNSIVTFDALHTQKKTTKIIVEKGGLYVGGLKGNNEGLFKEASALFTSKLKKSKEKSGFYLEHSEKAHGQLEKRKYYMIRKPKESFTGNGTDNEWADLKSIICYEKSIENLNTGKTECETRYYLSNLSCTEDNLQLASEAIRGHWGIENQLHWFLDASFDEDANSTMDSKAFNNLSVINKMALTICKIARPVVGSPSIRVASHGKSGVQIGISVMRKLPLFHLPDIDHAELNRNDATFQKGIGNIVRVPYAQGLVQLEVRIELSVLAGFLHGENVILRTAQQEVMLEHKLRSEKVVVASIIVITESLCQNVILIRNGFDASVRLYKNISPADAKSITPRRSVCAVQVIKIEGQFHGILDIILVKTMSLDTVLVIHKNTVLFLVRQAGVNKVNASR